MPTSPGEPGGFWRRSFPALGERQLRKYLAGQFVSYGGGVAQAVALSLLVYELTASAWLVGFANFLLFAPVLLVAPLTGGRLSRDSVKPVLLATLFANTGVSLALWWYASSGESSQVILLSLALVNGILSAIEMPARLVLIPSSSSSAAGASSGFALNILANNLARMIGAPAGAFLFGASHSAPFACAAAGYAVMFAFVANIHLGGAAGEKAAKAPGLIQGLRYARSDPFASFFLPAIGAVGLFAGSYATLVPLLAGIELGDLSRYTGLFLGAAGAGSVMASIVLASRASSPKPWFIHANQWMCAACLIVVVAPTGVPGAMLAFCVLGWSLSYGNAASAAAMLRRCPVEMRGPIAGLYAMGYAGAPPLGHALAGALSNQIGVKPTFLTMAVALAASLLLLRLLRGPMELDS